MQKAATRDAYGKKLVELGKTNPDVVVLDADLSGSTRTGWFAKDYPDRFFNVGIAEQNLIGVAAGLSLTGKIPFASSFAMFATGRCWEQIRNTVCYPKLNVKVVATHSGITVGEDGATHQALEDVSIMRSIPRMNVIVPADSTSTSKMIEVLADYYGPCYMRLNRSSSVVFYKDEDVVDFKIGGSNKLLDGNDVTIIACGSMVAPAVEAAETLKKENISASVIDMYSIKPIDEAAIVEAAEKTGAIVTAEEHSVIGGLGSAVCEVVAENQPVPVKRIGVQGVFGESGTPDELLEKYGLMPEDIVRAAKQAISKK